MVRVDAENLVPAFTASILQVMLDIGERLVDLFIDFPVELASLTVPTTWTRRDQQIKQIIQSGWLLTLACALDPVSDSNSLAVLEFLAIPLANALVGEILQVRHDKFLLL